MSKFSIPILFLIFNRPDTTKIAFQRIKEIAPKYLYIAADGPRTGKTGEDLLCQQTRDLVYSFYHDDFINYSYYFEIK